MREHLAPAVWRFVINRGQLFASQLGHKASQIGGGLPLVVDPVRRVGLAIDPAEDFRDLVGADGDTWRRGRVIAISQAVGLVPYYVVTNPALSRLGQRML